MRLTFASYNIHKAIGLDRRRKPERIITVLREMNADVIALQEADRRLGTRAAAIPLELLDETPWRPAPVAKRDFSMGWHGNALLVRRDIDIEVAEPFDLPTIEPRGAVQAELTYAGHRFRVFGMHLDISGLRRREQIKTVLARAASDEPDFPTIILGDFNQWGTRSGAMQEFGDGWTTLSPGRSYPSRRPVARFDRIAVSRHWNCLKQGVHRSSLSSRASDHLPILAKLELLEK